MTTPTLESYDKNKWPNSRRTSYRSDPAHTQDIRNQYEADRIQRNVEYGKCFCGCLSVTKVSTANSLTSGIVKGLPQRYLPGHQHRLSPVDYVLEDRGFHKGPCWIWQLGKDSLGYGRGKNNKLAHRNSYEQAHGPISSGLHLDHLCRTPSCVNPDHLEPVTNAVNTRRGLVARLNEEDITRIFALRESRMTHKEIAGVIGVKERTISHVLAGTRWKDVIDAAGFKIGSVPKLIARDKHDGQFIRQPDHR